MKIYLAGTSVSTPENEPKIQALFKRGSKLHSYYHSKDGGFEKKWFEVNMKNKVDLFLDSGAFSAWSQGAVIDIQEYIAFIKEHQDSITAYANLDVIGDAEATWKNQMIMERAGMHPLPVFHYKDDRKWLKRYLKRGYEYMALGGLITSDRSTLFNFLDDMFANYLCDADGMPIIKVHGFGLTGLGLMLRYPWYSVDSTAWVMTGRNGGIYVPRCRGGKWIYDENSWKVAVSFRSPSAKEAGAHINTLPPGQKQIILDYIHSKGYKLGKSSFKTEPQEYILADNEKWGEKRPKNKEEARSVEIIEEEGLSNKYQLRDELNIIYFLDLEKSMPEYPWAFKRTAASGLGLV